MLTVVGSGVLFLRQQQPGLSSSQGVIHFICVLGAEINQAMDVDAVGDEADEHGSQHTHIIQHPSLAQRFLRQTSTPWFLVQEWTLNVKELQG